MTHFAYIVMSYKDPLMIRRMVGALRQASPNAEIVLRHDVRHLPLPDLTGVAQVWVRPAITAIEWGHWSMVEAMLTELRWVRETLNVSNIVFISGQDYPTKSLERWEAEHSAWDATMVADLLRFKPRWLYRRGYDGTDDLTRYNYAWFGVPGTRTRSLQTGRTSVRVRATIFNNVRPAAYFRRLPHGRGDLIGLRRCRSLWSSSFQCYKGWPWLALSIRAADAVLQADKRLVRIYRRSLIPEESFFQTVLLNDPDMRVNKQPLSFTHWSGQVEHPRVLTEYDLNAVIASQLPFARKVETGTSDLLLDGLDRRIDNMS